MTFKPIVKHPNYGVSEDGRVINFSTGKVLQANRNGHNYLLFNAGAKFKLSIHRQVALLYVPNPNNYPVVNHKDGNKQNNNYSNLEWTTSSGNSQHAFDMGLCKPVGLGKFGKLNVRSKPVLQLTKEGVLIREWESANQATREKGFNDGTISMACNGKLKSHKGFIFKFK